MPGLEEPDLLSTEYSFRMYTGADEVSCSLSMYSSYKWHRIMRCQSPMEATCRNGLISPWMFPILCSNQKGHRIQ